ncbi:trypsin-like peptidase domain-containing protein [Luteolibacter ambystomatis]|uniref:Trypsin-like peptidase domain-containing protein n=1 Tax=Luteolibacter ambystomatis TaxID=2824561 RepID=A0A975G5V8_9BACT|nr:serine protease [Luteolibacter ambystomatis]QUE49358.1 trypsin-like peptidase domain-containing protein [Luteolibacter ambystomatis]
MSPRPPTDLPLAGILGISLLVSSCDKPKDTAETKGLRTQIANLQADTSQLNSENEALKMRLQQMDGLRQRAEKAESDVADLQRRIAQISSNAPTAPPSPETAVTTPESVPAPASGGDPLNFPQVGPDTGPTDKALANRLLASVVIIKGDQSEGTGFFARQNGKTYLYTAAHVLSGNSKLDIRTTAGRTFTKFGAFEVAEAADMVRFAMQEEPASPPPELATNEMKVGHGVFAIGNSGGGGVLTILDGTVTGLGPNQIETSAAVIQGNSGGPLFTAPEGRALGIITHLIAARTDVWAAATPFADVRRFAARLDVDVKWKTVPIASFLEERRRIEEVNGTTRLLLALSTLQPTTAGLRAGGQSEKIDALGILQQNRTRPSVKALLEMNSSLAGNRMRQSDRDLIKKFTGFYEAILSESKRQTAGFDPERFGPYHRELAKESLEWSKAAQTLISDTIQGLNK